jgi:CRISPR-associated protein Cas2
MAAVGRRFVVVAYDIPDDRRRERLHNLLLDYGTPVQYSVFECLVDEEEWERLKRRVERVTKKRLDHVRYYTLCGSCQKRIEVTGGQEVAHEPDVIIV